MSTVVNFGGRQCIEPGAYATTVYTPTSVVNVAEFGNVMLIDTGLSMREYAELPNSPTLEFSGGSGINGALAKSGKAVYEFDAIEDFREFVGGGELAAIAEKLFTPRSGVFGAPKVYYTRAAKTTPAEATISIDAGTEIVLSCKNEGVSGNGIIDNGVLKVGYAYQVVGTVDSGYSLQILRGNFGGYDVAGDRINAWTWGTAGAEIIAESPIFIGGESTSELSNWLKTDAALNSQFVVQITKIASTFTVITAATLTAFADGTSVYLGNTDMADVMDAIEELDVTFFLGTNLTVESATDAASNSQIHTYIKTQAKYGSVLFVPAGSSDTDLFGDTNTSQSVAKYYNDAQVVVVHGSPQVPRLDNPRDTKYLPSVYLAADIIGLNAGMAAQTPLTFKRVGFSAFKYDLKRKEREKALQAGIMHVRNVSGNWVVNQGITSLQDNRQTYDPQGNSLELSIELIKAQVNKELIIEAERRFVGMTAAQASPQSVKNFTETKLQSLVAEIDNDNLILGWRNVRVTSKNSDYYVNYDFIPNVPVNKVFFVGNVLDFTVAV
jgi:hypothetical protein